MLNQLIQNSWGSNFIELQVSMYYLVWSSFLVQTNYKTKLMPGLLLRNFFCNTWDNLIMSLMTQWEFLLYLSFSKIFKYTFVCVAPLKSGPWTLHILKIATEMMMRRRRTDEMCGYVSFYYLSSSCVHIFGVLSVKCAACFLIRAFYYAWHLHRVVSPQQIILHLLGTSASKST